MAAVSLLLGMEAERQQPSHVDAMGQDKRRQVVGHSYGPTRRSQIMFFVAVAAVAVAIVGGWLLLVGLFDKPPTHFKDTAPWSTTPASAQLAAEQNAKPISPGDALRGAGQPVSDPSAEPVRAAQQGERLPGQLTRPVGPRPSRRFAPPSRTHRARS